jgi:hypothetical protein
VTICGCQVIAQPIAVEGQMSGLVCFGALQYDGTARENTIDYCCIGTAKVRLRIIAVIWSLVTGISTLRLAPEGETVTLERASAKDGSVC